jgi:hypothetical protein
MNKTVVYVHSGDGEPPWSQFIYSEYVWRAVGPAQAVHMASTDKTIEALVPAIGSTRSSEIVLRDIGFKHGRQGYLTASRDRPIIRRTRRPPVGKES